MIAELNVLVAVVSVLGFLYTYVESAMPATRAEREGERAWQTCRRYRALAGILIVIPIIDMVVWLWFPIRGLEMVVCSNPWIPLLVSVGILVPAVAILARAMHDLGSESWSPSTATQLGRGIYRSVRHPQLLGRALAYLAIAVWMNSLFWLVFVIAAEALFLPTIVHYEEKDLLKRFGASYRKYRQTTGALLPRLRRRPASQRHA
jgi:protein-S-isoprenylcysteine O-methyltransferase Ste14